MTKKILKITTLLMIMILGIIGIEGDTTLAAGSSQGGGGGTSSQQPNVTRNGGWLNQTFRNQEPNDLAIIQALFGTRDMENNTGINPSTYTSNRRFDRDITTETRDGSFSRGRCQYNIHENPYTNIRVEPFDGMQPRVFHITGHTLNFQQTVNGNHYLYNDGDIGTLGAVFVLETDYVVITGSIGSRDDNDINPFFSCVAIVSNRTGGTTILTNDNVGLFRFGSTARNIILDNVHLDGGYISPTVKKAIPTETTFLGSFSAWNNDAAYYIGNITLNNITISNFSKEILSARNSRLDSEVENLLFNNMTTYNNRAQNLGALFYLLNSEVQSGNIIFNNRKSFDLLSSIQTNIHISVGNTISINNSYFHPGSNPINIMLDGTCRTPAIINNVVGNISTNQDVYVHNLIGTLIEYNYKATVYGYYKHFSNTGTTYFKGVNYNGYGFYRTAGQNAQNLGCLTWDYMINPTTGNFYSPKYNWNSSAVTSLTGCVTRSNGSTEIHYTDSGLKFSYGKNIPTQEIVVIHSGYNNQDLYASNIPINSQNYIAGPIKTTQTFSSEPTPLRNGDSRAKVNSINGTVSHFNLFGPYIIQVVAGQKNSWANLTFTNPDEYGQRVIIGQVYGYNYYATHFSNVVMYTGSITPPEPEQGQCTFNVHNITVNECSSSSWTPLYNYNGYGHNHSTPFRLYGYSNTRVNYRDVAINYYAPRTPTIITYTGQCRYTRNNQQGREIDYDSELPVTITVNDTPVTANNFSVGNVGCGTGVNRKTLSSANEGACGNSDLTAEILIDGNFGSCSINGNTITYEASEGLFFVGEDTCTIRIRDDENNEKDITASWSGAHCTVSGQLFINEGAEYTNDPDLSIKLMKTGNIQIQSKDLSCDSTSRITPNWYNLIDDILGIVGYIALHFNLSGGQGGCDDSVGIKTVYALLNGYSTIHDDILFDNISPKVSVYARQGLVIIHEDDPNESFLSGGQQIKYKWVSGGGTCPLDINQYSNHSVSYLDGDPSVTVQLNTPGNHGTYRLCIYSGFYDRAGNPSALASSVYTFPPSGGGTPGIEGSITINNDDEFTNNTTLHLSLSAIGTYEITRMQFSCDWSGRTAEENYSMTKDFSLQNYANVGCNINDEQKTVYVRFKDSQGNVGGAASDNIILDKQNPVVTILSVSPEVGGSISVSDNLSGLSGSQSLYYYRNTNTSCPNNINSYQEQQLYNGAGVTHFPTVVAPPETPGTYYLCIFGGIRDRAGNESLATYYSTPTPINPQTIQGSITINNGAVATNNRNLNLGLYASGASTMQFSCNQISRSPAISYRTSYSRILGGNYGCTSSEGSKTVYVKYIRGSNSITRNDSIIYDTIKPSVTATQNGNTVTVTVSDNNAGLNGSQVLQYKRTDSSICPNDGYSSKNLNNSAGIPSTQTHLNSPGNGYYNLCIQSGIKDRAGNTSDRQNVGRFCFGDNCHTPPPSNGGCRWSTQPTPSLVGEINKRDGIAAFSCQIGVQTSDDSIFSQATSNESQIDCNDVLQAVIPTSDGIVLDDGSCESSTSNGIQTIRFLYKNIEERIRTIPYDDTSTAFVLQPSNGLENYISEKVFSNPIRFDFEGPKTNITEYSITTNGGRHNIDFRVQDNDNRDTNGNISVCYYEIDYGNGNISQGTRNCGEMESIYTNKSFQISARAIDDLGNTGSRDKKIIYLSGINSTLERTVIHKGTHMEYNNTEYFKGSITLRAKHNNLGIERCEYTIDGGNTWEEGELGGGFCESKLITPSSNIVGNFRVLTINGDYITGTSLYAVLDNVAPQPEIGIINCVGDRWCNYDQYEDFVFYDTGIGMAEMAEFSCIIKQEGRNVSCTVTGVNVCDIIGNCYTDDLVSREINLDKTPPIGRFENVQTGCTNTTEDNVTITGYDLLSGLPTEFINIGGEWTGERIIPIESGKTVWLRDNANNFTLIGTEKDIDPPKIQTSTTFTGYECSEINAYIDAIDTGCAGGNKLTTSFNGGAFRTGRTIQYSENLRFDYNATENVVTGKTIPFIVKDNFDNSSSGNINLQRIDYPVTGHNIHAYVSFRLTTNLQSDINWKEESEAHAGSCETVTAVASGCNGGGTITISGDMLHYEYDHGYLNNGWSDSCQITISDDDGNGGIVITINYSLCLNSVACRPEVEATIIGGPSFIDRCYNTGDYVHTNGTFLYDLSACSNMPAMQHNSGFNSKYTSGSQISINLNMSGSLGPKEYRVSCIKDDTYCRSVSTGWNDIGCDDIYTGYFEQVWGCTRSNNGNSLGKCIYDRSGNKINSNSNGYCRRDCDSHPSNAYFTGILGCVPSSNPNDGPCLYDNIRNELWGNILNVLIGYPGGYCRRGCSLNIVSADAIRDRIDQCKAEWQNLTQHSGGNICDSMENARSNWMPFTNTITFDLENGSGCAKNGNITPGGSKFQSERTVWVQVKDNDGNVSAKTPTDVVVYDLGNYSGKKRYDWERSPVLREVSSAGSNDSINVVVEAEDDRLIYDIIGKKGDESATEKLTKQFYIDYIASYSPFSLGKSENSDWFKRGTCSNYATITETFKSPINNSCTCSGDYCNKPYTIFAGLTHDIPAIHTGCSGLSIKTVTNVTPETASNNPNYICQGPLTGINCQSNNNYTWEKITYSKSSNCNTACRNSDGGCYKKMDINTESTTCGQYNSYDIYGTLNSCTNARYAYIAITIGIGLIGLGDCEQFYDDGEIKYTFYRTNSYVFYKRIQSSTISCETGYNECSLYSCNEYDNRNDYECTYRECTDFSAACLAYSTEEITTGNYIEDSDCYCIEATEESRTGDISGIDPHKYRCNPVYGEEGEDPEEYQCFECTQYSCKVQGNCIQWNTGVDFFYLQYDFTKDPAHLKTKRNENIGGGCQTGNDGTSLLELHLTTQSGDRLITGYNYQINSQSALNRVSKENISIKLNNLPICEKNTGYFSIRINTGLVTDFAYNPTNFLNVTGITYNPTNIDICCECDLNDTGASCYAYCCNKTFGCSTTNTNNRNGTGYCEDLDCFCASASHANHHACLCRNNPNSKDCACEWSDSCSYIGSGDDSCKTRSGYCESTVRNEAIGHDCTCYPEGYSGPNDYISGNMLFEQRYPGKTTGEYCQVQSCTTARNILDKKERCNTSGRNITYETNGTEYCCCENIKNTPDKKCSDVPIKNNLYVNEINYIQTGGYIPSKEQYYEEYNSDPRLVHPYPLTIRTTSPINNNYNITCVKNDDTCPGFSCDTATGLNNQRYSVGVRKYSHTLPVIKLDIEGYDDLTGLPKRQKWTGCIIKFEPPTGIGTDTPEVIVTFNILTGASPFLAGHTGEEQFYQGALKDAISEWSGDKGFFFYISQPQRIKYGINEANQIMGVLGDISYDIQFSTGIADEFYYITGTATIDGYKKELYIKKPTFNYSNPYSYLFNLPEYGN